MGMIQFPLAGAIDAGLGKIKGVFRDSPSTPPSAPPSAEPTPPHPAADLIQAQDAARQQYAPKPGQNTTYCNLATFGIARQMKAPLGPLGNSRNVPYTANQMAQNLALSTHYHDVTPEQAQNLADQGHLVIGAWGNSAGHGHVVTVRPRGIPGDQPFGDSGPVLNDIGENARIARQSGAFKAGDQVDY